MIETKRVVVTGMGVVAPEAETLQEFNEILYSGRSLIRHIDELEEYGFDAQNGAIANPEIDEKNELLRLFEIDLTSDFIKLAVKAAYNAWLDAGLPLPDPDSDEVDFHTGVMIGGVISGIEMLVKKVIPIVDQKRPKRLGSMIVQNTMPSGASAYISSIFALGNHALSLNSACSTGVDSINWGYHSIASGWAERMVVGAADAYNPYSWAGFEGMRVLNRSSNDAPEKASRPMSASAKGFVPGSGAGVLILEELNVARARGARIYAEVLGGFSNCGALRGGGSMTFPNREGVIRALKSTFEVCRIRAEEIDYINGHLSGTMADPFEVQNWYDAMQLKDKAFPYINSTKSILGHSLGAAGSIEIIATLLQLQHGYVHASLNTEDLHPQIEKLIGRDSVPLKRVDFPDMRIAAKANFGFGDVNSAIILKKYEE